MFVHMTSVQCDMFESKYKSKAEKIISHSKKLNMLKFSLIHFKMRAQKKLKNHLSSWKIMYTKPTLLSNNFATFGRFAVLV